MSPFNWFQELFARAVFEGCVEGFERFRGHMAGEFNEESIGGPKLPTDGKSVEASTPSVEVSSPPLAQWVERLRLPNSEPARAQQDKPANPRRPRKRTDDEQLG